MAMWLVISSLIIIALIAGFVWMSFAVYRLINHNNQLPKKRWVRFFTGAAITLGGMVAAYLVFDFVNMVIIFLHLLLIWLLCDGVSALIRRFRHTSVDKGKYLYPGICAITLTIIWLSIGWYNAHHVCRTEYNLTTDKMIGEKPLKIVGLSDSHIGAIFHWQEFEQYIQEINQEKPDLVVVMGDFIDDDTSLEDMTHSCEALGHLRTRYGVYFVYGNHDEGYWASHRGYTLEELDKQLTANGIKILRDDMLPISDHIYICGRLDKSRSKDRKSATELMTGRNKSDYVICLDHQPNDYEAEANSKMDLVMSGHTHGGQLLGLGPIGVWMGANDAYYGHEHHNATDFIVSSGISNWALNFKTGCISEYVVININARQ